MIHTLKQFAPYLCLLALCITACLFRPLLPIDETRYLTVAWEMFLNKNFAVMSLNFHPYHHKPPMLFWLINLAWHIFGVSRAAAMIPVFVASGFVIYAAQKLSEKLGHPQSKIIPWLIIGSIPFLMYSSMMMFDMMVAAFVLATLLMFYTYAKDGKLFRVFAAGLLMGLGVLTKGPVVYLYLLWPLCLYPLWRRETHIGLKKFYIAIAIAVLISILPVAAWLIPTLLHTDKDFAFWLVWNQTAGRVTGNFKASHVRPVYFYTLLLPVLFLPWVFLPLFWKQVKSWVKSRAITKSQWFLISATLPCFLCFSLISGKQPHYLLPLLPFIVIFIGFCLSDLSLQKIKIISLSVVFLVITGQIVASETFLVKYDLKPFVEIYNQHRGSDWAFAHKYQGELGFLARIEKPIDNIEKEQISAWLQSHPNGYVIVRYNHEKEDMSAYKQIYSSPYKGKNLGIFVAKDQEAIQ